MYILDSECVRLKTTLHVECSGQWLWGPLHFIAIANAISSCHFISFSVVNSFFSSRPKKYIKLVTIFNFLPLPIINRNIVDYLNGSQKKEREHNAVPLWHQMK